MGINGEDWRIRVRGVLISTTAYASLREQAKFHVFNEKDMLEPASKTAFRRARIIFQEDKKTYINDVLELLTHDNDVDKLMAWSMQLFHADGAVAPKGSALEALRNKFQSQAMTEAEFVGYVLRKFAGASRIGGISGD